MRFFKIQISSLTIDQPSLIQELKELGGNSIQTSNGLFVAIETTPAAREGIEISEVNPANDIDLTPDMKKLIQDFS